MKNVSGTFPPVVSAALFLAAVLGQVWFWRNCSSAGPRRTAAVLYVELAFLAVIRARPAHRAPA
ncbi:MAG: hypothetical protein ACLVL7_06695 [Anaerotruncus massiliensis (ex Togo et al. 2019)]